MEPLTSPVISVSRSKDPLHHFGRVWSYTQGLALHQSARKGDERAHKLARWLKDTAVKVTLDDGSRIYGGWHFSQNTIGDNFKDTRRILGASMWAMHGLVKYLTAPIFKELSQDEADQFKRFYKEMLDGLIHNQRWQDGLFSAGWKPKALAEANSGREFYDILNRFGYVAWEEITPVKALNVVIEHNIDVLSVLNYSIKHAEALGLNKADYLPVRDRLREGIFTKLYNFENRHFITGLSSDNVTPSRHMAIDNTS